MRRARASSALAAHLAQLSVTAPAEVPSAAPFCRRPGLVPVQSARMFEAADEEVKSPDGAPEPDMAEAAARFPLILMVSGLRAACESVAMRWLRSNSPGAGARACTERAGCWMLEAAVKSCAASDDALRCTAEGIGDKGAHL